MVVLGTTAETPTLSEAEKKEILSFVIRQNNKRLPVVAGIGGNNTEAVIRSVREYPVVGIDGILSVVPYYNKPNQEALYQHFKAIAASTEKPLILYNVPGRTATNMAAATAFRLATDCKNIVAIKEASGNMAQCMDLVQNAPAGFSVLSGDDDLALAQAALGFSGIISVAANCFPRHFSEMIRLAGKNEFTAAREHHYQMLPAIRMLFEEGNPAGVKAMLSHQGLCENHLRLPLIPASASLEDRLASFAGIR